MDTESTIQIRQAVQADAGVMMSLIKELAVYENAPDAVTVTLDHFIESGFGRKPVWWALVAIIPASGGRAEQIVGFALYYIRYSTWKGQRMYLEDIIVTEEWRGKGVGTKLMDALILEATSQKFSGMLWQVLEWNEPAIKFYRKYKASFDEEWINVSLEL